MTTFLRYSRRSGQLLATPHASLEDALAAQLEDDHLGGQLDLIERVDGDTTEIIPDDEIRQARPTAPTWRVLVSRPGHGQAIAGIFAEEHEADDEARAVADLIGADRVTIRPTPTL